MSVSYDTKQLEGKTVLLVHYGYWHDRYYLIPSDVAERIKKAVPGNRSVRNASAEIISLANRHFTEENEITFEEVWND